MFRISSNWRTGANELHIFIHDDSNGGLYVLGRCTVEQLNETVERPLLPSSTTDAGSFPEQTHILLAGNLTITASSKSILHPPIHLRSPIGTTHSLFSGSPTHNVPTQITALALDQSPPAGRSHLPGYTNSHNLQLASFLSTGEFTIFTINHASPSSSTRKLTYVPTIRNARTSPIIQAVYHHPLLVTLSKAFHLSIYDLSGGTVAHCQTLTSFTSHPPSSLVLSTPSPTTYKLVLAYAIPVYPAHWSVGATELIISGPTFNRDISPTPSSAPFSSASQDPSFTTITTRSTRAFDVPQGWIDENKLRSMREQWGRKVERVADTQTDGKWVVLAPGGVVISRESSPFTPTEESSNTITIHSSPSSNGRTGSQSSTSSSSSSSSTSSLSLHSPTHLQLYRLHLPASASASTLPKLTFIRTLHGQTGQISALALADGRCVSLSTNGSIWVWDLEAGTGAEVAEPTAFSTEPPSGSGFPNQYLNTWGGKGTVVFDERRIISAGLGVVQVRRFDV
jgi:hypothetical protein